MAQTSKSPSWQVMTGSPRKSQPGRQLRSGTLLGVEGEDQWQPATTFGFPGSPSPSRSNKAEKKKSPNVRKLRRQTMMPTRQAAAPTTALASPPSNQRRTRRQSMMLVRLQVSPVGDKRRSAKPASPDTAKAKTKRKLEPLEESPTSKKSRLVPASKSTAQVKTAPSPPPSKKHKSMSALPVARSSRRAAKTSEAPVQTKKSPAKKRALSPVQLDSSPPKRRAASRSRSESKFVRSKSIPRGQKKSAVSLKVVSPVAKKTVTPSKQKASSSSLKSPASKTTPKKKSTASLKTAAVSSKVVSPAAKKTVTPSKQKASSSSLKSPASKTTPKKKSMASLKTAASPVSKGQKTPKKASKTKLPAPTKTPSPSKAKSPSSLKKSQTKTINASATKKILTKTPSIVLKKVKVSAINTPPSIMKKRTPKQVTPATPSPRRPRLTRSAAKSRIVSSKSVRHVSLKVDGKSPPSSLASFRKTPSSKRTAAVAFPADLGASPALPSAHEQLQRIRTTLTAKKHSTPPPKSLPAFTPAPSLDKGVTQADIHASGNGKCGSEAVLNTHCTPTARLPLPMTPKSSRSSGGVSRFTSRLASSTVESRYLQHTGPHTPHSSTPIKGSHTLEVIGARPPLKDRSSVEEEVDGGRADTSVEESMEAEDGESSVEESVEEEEQEEEEEEEEEANSSAKTESTSQNRKSYCSLM